MTRNDTLFWLGLADALAGLVLIWQHDHAGWGGLAGGVSIVSFAFVRAPK